MPRFIRTLLLPAALFLVFSAEDCDGPDVRVREEITVHPDASISVALEYEGDSISWLLDWDPPPTLEIGWDSVHLGSSGKERYALRAWNRFPPGAELPGTYARPADALSDWYVHFPSVLTTEENGDTVFFHYQRTYPALDWISMELFEALFEEIDRVEWEIDSLDFDQRWEALEARWEDSVEWVAWDSLEPGPDTILLRQIQDEFTDMLQAGNPSLVELDSQLWGGHLQIAYLSGVALVVPAVNSLPIDANPGCSDAVMTLILDPLDEIGITREDQWKSILREFHLEPELGESPEVGAEGNTFDFGPEIERLWDHTLDRVRETLRTECRLTVEALINFNQRFEWLARRYRIENGKLRSQEFTLLLSMPGELLKTNADTVINGQARWKFDVADLTVKDLTLTAKSRVIR